MAGNLTIESCGQLFQRREASSQYGIGTDGRIGCYCDEDDRSWCTSSSSNDNRAITIEVANTQAKYPWPVSDKAYSALIDLIVDICKRHKIKKLLWQADKSLIGQVDKQNMSVHRWFAAKECPGDYLYNRHGEIAELVNKRLGDELDMTKAEFIESLTNEEALKIVNKARLAMRNQEASDYAKEALDWAKNEGIMVGDETGNLMPRDTITREQVVTILKREDEKDDQEVDKLIDRIEDLEDWIRDNFDANGRGNDGVTD